MGFFWRTTLTKKAAIAVIGSFLVAAAMVPRAAAAPAIDYSFQPGELMAGLAWDDTSDTLFVFADWETTIRKYTATGDPVGTIPLPGRSGYHLDMDMTTAPVPVGGTTSPAGSLLVFSSGDNTLYSVDPTSGTKLGSIASPHDSLTVGLAHHPTLGTVFMLDNGGRIREVDPSTGTVLNQFTIPAPAGGSGMFISRGDVDVDPKTGNLLVAGSADYMREITTDGEFLRQIDLSHLPAIEGGASGMAFDDAGELWLATSSDDADPSNDLVFKLSGLGSGSAELPKECSETGAICTGDDDDVVEGTSGDNFIFTAGGDDIVMSADGNDTVLAGAGNDQVAAGLGADTVKGGSGNDKIWGDASNAPTRRQQTGTAPSNDVLDGGGGNDVIFGEVGNDRLNGGGGKDILKGGPGIDILKGGPGKDTCYGDKKDKFRSCERLRRHI